MSKQIRKLCGEITALAVGIEKHDVFINYYSAYYPNCEVFQIRIYIFGWTDTRSADPDENIRISLSGNLAPSQGQIMSNLKAVKTKLEDLL